MSASVVPLITREVSGRLDRAREVGETAVELSLDLGRSLVSVQVDQGNWWTNNRKFPFLERCKERTIYYWDGQGFEPVSRFGGSLIKLVPTPWGPPTFEIDGIKMLPSEHVSPWEDAERKAALVKPAGKVILDTCGGLGYFASACLRASALKVLSFEKNPDVLWLRTLNPWSPGSAWSAHEASRLTLVEGDITDEIRGLPAASVQAILHDPPRFGIAGELYSQVFYDELARVLMPRGLMFHYTGRPNRLTSGRDVPAEVAHRLRAAGFTTALSGDGVLATKKRR